MYFNLQLDSLLDLCAVLSLRILNTKFIENFQIHLRTCGTLHTLKDLKYYSTKKTTVLARILNANFIENFQLHPRTCGTKIQSTTQQRRQQYSHYLHRSNSLLHLSQQICPLLLKQCQRNYSRTAVLESVIKVKNL